MRIIPLSFLSFWAFLSSLWTTPVAAELSKESCVEAHSAGQDAREQGKLAAARTLFTSCAQSECPAPVQADCARFVDELSRYQPWVSFAARDAHGRDLPDTSVYVDGTMVVTELDGRPHELDPGSHFVRFVHGDQSYELDVLVGEGEQGRVVLATFAAPPPPAPAPRAEPHAEQPARLPRLATGARVLILSGSALIAAGGALALAGLLKLPSTCSLARHECAGPPDDPSLDRAASAMRLGNAGWAVAGTGGAVVATGLVWQFVQTAKRREHAQVAPWLGPSAAGLAFSSSL